MVLSVVASGSDSEGDVGGREPALVGAPPFRSHRSTPRTERGETEDDGRMRDLRKAESQFRRFLWDDGGKRSWMLTREPLVDQPMDDRSTNVSWMINQFDPMSTP